MRQAIHLWRHGQRVWGGSALGFLLSDTQQALLELHLIQDALPPCGRASLVSGSKFHQILHLLPHTAVRDLIQSFRRAHHRRVQQVAELHVLEKREKLSESGPNGPARPCASTSATPTRSKFPIRTRDAGLRLAVGAAGCLHLPRKRELYRYRNQSRRQRARPKSEPTTPGPAGAV